MESCSGSGTSCSLSPSSTGARRLSLSSMTAKPALAGGKGEGADAAGAMDGTFAMAASMAALDCCSKLREGLEGVTKLPGVASVSTVLFSRYSAMASWTRDALRAFKSREAVGRRGRKCGTEPGKSWGAKSLALFLRSC